MSDLNRERKAGRTELYRHFAADGALLYVGISMSTAQRIGEHRCVSGWWRKVVSITIERFPTREAALKAERKAIQTEHPKHNVTAKLRGFRTGGSTAIPREPWRVEADAITAKLRAEIAARTEAPC